MTFPAGARGIFLAWLGSLCLAFVIGHGTRKTIEVEKVREVEKAATAKVEAAKAEVVAVKKAANDDTTRWRTRTVYLPGGTVEVTKEVVREVEKKQEERAAQVITKTVVQERIVYKDREKLVVAKPPSWALGVGAGLGLDGRARYGGDVGRRLFGSLWLTAGVDVSTRAAQLGLRLEF